MKQSGYPKGKKGYVVDHIVPLECGERYAKALPRARLEIVEGAGHFVEMEQPDPLASLVTRFLTEA